MNIRIDNRNVYVDGKRIENPGQRLAIAIPAVIFALVMAAIGVFILIPVLGLSLLVLATVAIAAIFWLFAWLVTPLAISTLTGLGLLRWWSRRQSGQRR